MEDRLIARLGEMEVSVSREISRLRSLVEDKVVPEVKHLSKEVGCMKTDTVPIMRDAVVSQVVEKMKNAGPTVSELVAKSISSMEEKVDQKLTVLVAEYEKQLDKYRRGLLSEVGSEVAKCCSLIKDICVKTAREQVIEAIAGSITLSDSALKALQEKIDTAVSSAVSSTLPTGITDQVLTIIDQNLNKAVGTKVQKDLQLSVDSIKNVLVHDVQGALNGVLKTELQDIGVAVIKNMQPSVHKATVEFFTVACKNFVEYMVDQLNESLASKKVVMTPNTLLPLFTKLHTDVLTILRRSLEAAGMQVPPVRVAPFQSPPSWDETCVTGKYLFIDVLHQF